MTSSRRRRTHADNDGAWGHALNEPWREQLEQVDAALNKLGDPLRDPLMTVTGTEFVNALWQLPASKRSRFLSDLKVPSAKRPSVGTEDGIGAAALARMSRWKDEQLSAAIAFLTYDALVGPVNNLAHSDADASSVMLLAEYCLDELLAGGIPPGLLVAGLVAALRDVAPGATLAAWLRRHPLPGSDPADSAHQDAAERIVSVLTTLPWHSVTPADEPSVLVDGDVFAATHSAAQDAYTEAAAHVSAALLQLQELKVPDVAGVTRSVQQVEQLHRTLAGFATGAAAAAGLELPGDDLDLGALAALFAAAVEASDPVRQRTGRLRCMELSGELAACDRSLEQLCGAADDGDPGAVELVAGIIRLADAKHAGASLTELSALDAQLRPTLPAELAPLMLGLMLGQVSTPHDAPAVTGPAPAKAVQVAPAASTAASDTAPVADPSQTVQVTADAGATDAEQTATDDPAQLDPPAEPAPLANAEPPAPVAPAPAEPAATVVDSHDLGDAQDTAEEGTPDDGADALRRLVLAAVDDHDTGLGYWLASAGNDSTLAEALKVATLAETLRGETGTVAEATVTALESLDPNALGRDRLAALAALAAAMQTTIVTGSPDAGTVLELLSVHVTDQVGLRTLAEAIATAAQRGALAGGQLRPLRDDSSIAAELVDVRETARAEMGRSRTALLARATDMAAELFAPHGAVGTLLTAVVDDDRQALDDVDADIVKLSDPTALRRLIDDLDREMRGTGSSARPLQGKARQRLHDWIEGALVPIREWVRIARLLQLSSTDRHVPGDLVALKTAAGDALPSVRDELLRLTLAGADSRSGAALLGTAVDIAEHLLAGQPAVGSCDGCTVEQVLGRALLRAPRIALDATLQPVRAGDVTVDALEEAFGSSWPDVISARSQAGDFGTARHAIAVAATGDPVQQQRYTRDLDVQLAAHRAVVVEQRAQLADDIRRATRLGQLGNDDQIRLTASLQVADAQTREDLNAVVAELEQINVELPSLAADASGEIAAHLITLVDDGKVSVDEERRVQARIDVGDLASADEILAAVEAGLDLPDPVTLDVIADFFPAVPDALGSGLSRAVIAAVRSGADAAGCRYAGLPEETRGTNADALDRWHTATVSHQRYQVGLAMLAAPLRLAGIEAQRDGALPASIRDAKSHDRRFVDLSGVSVIGNAIVPAFGSQLEGTLRLLLVWGPQTPQSIVNWVKQDSTDTAVLVCLFGTMSADARRKLAVATAALPGKPVAVLDDAALAYLASRPEASITTTMRVLLPFSTTNPYVPQAEGNVPSEMFYGRNHELSQLLARSGTSLVYGGRQLGKSALLRAAQRRHTSTGSGIAVYVSTQPSRPEEIWDLLRTALDSKGIRAAGRDAGRDAYAAVGAAVDEWLTANPGQRLLVMFDECDNFFDLDAIDSFAQTTRLRDMRNRTDERFKPIFAGLHEVARFASLPNQPFAHLGKPTPIGPLAPAEAFRLVTEPMAALGIRLDDVAWRVLAYCNYQPILLQLVCLHLVNHVYSQRDEFTLLPYVITDDEFERVWGSPELVAEVSGKLRLTLDLDTRYGVVARVLGLAALEDDKVPAMSTVALREECESWWPAGFTATTEDEFRALLIEMVALGVLAQEGANWALRSANVLRMLGTSEDIAATLFRADQATVPGPHIAGEARQLLSDARVAPLTAAQLADVIGQRNQLRIVLGSQATGADRIGDLLEQALATLGRFDLVRPNRHGPFIEALGGGQRGGKHRVVFSDVTDVRSQSVLSEIEEAQTRLPGDGVTRSAVLYLGVEQAEVWLELLGPAHGGMAADTVVACRRLDRIGLERWSHEQHGQFSDPADLHRLLELTGGWPLLVDSVAAACASGIGPSEALVNLRFALDGELGEELLAATGVPDSVLETGYAALVALGSDLLSDETDVTFEQLLGTERPSVLLSALVAAGAVTRNDSGTLSLEPVLARLWEAFHKA